MKVTFNPPNDGETYVHCTHCLQKTVEAFVNDEGLQAYTCYNCGVSNARALIIDPKVLWWVSAHNREYWHETAGIFVLNDQGEMLLFDRNKFPFGLTVPAGHVDVGETAQTAAQRELGEETGIIVSSDQLVHATTVDIVGDGCRRAADNHVWNAYVVRIPCSTTVKVDESEGSAPVWLTPSQALMNNLTFATRYMLENHLSDIMRAAGL